MSTRASTKRKRLTNSMTKSNKFRASRSLTEKRPESTTKPQSITRSPSSIHDDIATHDESSLEKDSLAIDCPDQSQHDRISTPEMVNSESKNSKTKKGPLNSSVITKHGIATRDESSTEAAYEKLEAVISSCSPIVERTSSTTDPNISSTATNGGSVVLDPEEQVILPPPLSQVTPTTNRINSSHISRLNRCEPRTDQYLSPSTSARKTANRSTTSSDRMRGSSSDIWPLDNNGSSSNNRNTNGAVKNNVHSSITTQSVSSNDRVRSQSTVLFLSTSPAVLESIPEYRNVKKELAQEQQRYKTWSDDYIKLRTEFGKYRASSFPRPSADGLNFLLQLIENLTVSNSSFNSHTHSGLAEAIGLSEEELTNCYHPNPQRAALLVFSQLYPTYRDRADLISVKTFSKTKSQLLDNIFHFARQCNPSTIHSMELDYLNGLK